MGNERADRIRAALREAVLERFGTLEAAAPVLGVPYKTLYRHLTESGKDRTARVPLDFVLDTCATLGITLGDLDTVSHPGATVTPIRSFEDIDHVETPDLEQEPFAAKEGTRRIDEEHPDH